MMNAVHKSGMSFARQWPQMYTTSVAEVVRFKDGFSRALLEGRCLSQYPTCPDSCLRDFLRNQRSSADNAHGPDVRQT